MVVGGGQSISPSTPDFALQCIPVHLLSVSSPGYTNLHNSPEPHSVSAYESINQTQKAFLWLLWAKARINHQKPSCALYTSLLMRPCQPFWVPSFLSSIKPEGICSKIMPLHLVEGKGKNQNFAFLPGCCTANINLGG